MSVDIKLYCDECGKERNLEKYAYCKDCYDALLDRIADLEKQIEELEKVKN